MSQVLATLLFVLQLTVEVDDSKARRGGNLFNGNYFGLKWILLHPATQCSEICINTYSRYQWLGENLFSACSTDNTARRRYSPKSSKSCCLDMALSMLEMF